MQELRFNLLRLVLSTSILSVVGTAHADVNDATKKRINKALEGCTSDAIYGGTKFKCDGVSATISDLSDVSAKLEREALFESFRILDKGTVKTSQVNYSASGKSWPATRLLFSLTNRPKPAFEGYLIGFKTPQSNTRQIFCGTSTARSALAKRCKEIIPLFADLGPEAFKVTQPEPYFLGKKVIIPNGCHLEDSTKSGFQIICGETALLNSTNYPTTSIDIVKVTRISSDQIKKTYPDAIEGKVRKCKVGGAIARCSVINVGKGEGALVYYIGSAVVGNEGISIQCGQRPTQQGVHPVCAQILEF